MPSSFAAAGSAMCAGRPWNRTSPASNGKMPATHLMSVDLPAPLSPTSAVTSPGSATRSTPRRACTAPKFLWPPRTSRGGGGVRLLLHGLVDRHALVAGQDVLQPLVGGVLPGDGHGAVHAVLLEDGDRGVAQAVVGGEDAVDLPAGLGVHLLEERAGLLV